MVTDPQWLCRVLDAAPYIVLGLSGEDGPYAVPLNFAHADGCIYFHSARQGRKLDCLRRDPRVSVTAVATARLVGQGGRACDMGMAYESVCASGTAEILTDGKERGEALRAIILRYGGDPATVSEAEARGVALVRVRLTCVSGKRANMS
ncbi:hypothetical protein DSM19430T_17910 [Desulfovibrio psychrotolerans]|uniref:MFS transporter n=2 Tax=Desulfovibrio psychrotolerans TaxID=415242 RepID=A0A7J0BTR2_9BACT|nr:hypothetical protein DSM19430T_17910 [Desulfovibrio psychrotolerans]